MVTTSSSKSLVLEGKISLALKINNMIWISCALYTHSQARLKPLSDW